MSRQTLDDQTASAWTGHANIALAILDLPVPSHLPPSPPGSSAAFLSDPATPIRRLEDSVRVCMNKASNNLFHNGMLDCRYAHAHFVKRLLDVVVVDGADGGATGVHVVVEPVVDRGANTEVRTVAVLEGETEDVGAEGVVAEVRIKVVWKMEDGTGGGEGRGGAGEGW